MIEIKGTYGEAKVFTDMLEESARGQISALCEQKFVKDSKIRIMPDVHSGKGCTIGTTMTVVDKAVPNIVGVDIGCGMHVSKLKQKEIDLRKLDEIMENYEISTIVVGMPYHLSGDISERAIKTQEFIHKLKYL